MVAMPFEGWVVMVQSAGPPSVSVEVAVPVTSVSSSPVPVRPPVMIGSSLTGALTGSTVMVTVAVWNPPLPSETCTSKVVVPDHPASGVYTQSPVVGSMDAAPSAGGETTDHVGLPPSTSADVAVAEIGSAPTPVPVSPPVMVGSSLIGLTVTVMVAVSVPPLPSDTSMSKVSVPDQSATGVYTQSPVVGLMVAVPFEGWVVMVQVG